MHSGAILIQVEESVVDAVARFGTVEFDVYAWVQSWADASCGFGRPAAQVVTDAVVIVATDGAVYRVYVCGEYAYSVPRHSDTIWGGIKNHRLPGRIEREKVGGSIEGEE